VDDEVSYDEYMKARKFLSQGKKVGALAASLIRQSFWNFTPRKKRLKQPKLVC